MTKVLPWMRILPVAHDSSMEALMQRLIAEGFLIGILARQLCKKVASTFVLPAGEVNIGLVQLKDLGFTQEIPAREFYARAFKQGYGLCSLAMALLVRLAYTHQEQLANPIEMSWMYIAMEPVEVDGYLMILRIASGTRNSRLDAVEFNTSNMPPKDNWLFTLK